MNPDTLRGWCHAFANEYLNVDTVGWFGWSVFTPETMLDVPEETISEALKTTIEDTNNDQHEPDHPAEEREKD